jgi:uncharacterized protein (DUF433 family)
MSSFIMHNRAEQLTGESESQILDQYPGLTKEDVLAPLREKQKASRARRLGGFSEFRG